ncbi:hypothetical protein X740_31810 [Mesorhizobium sp. LNHC221B00]|nr:hypothetical protein X740_31810 [Mesorhizobium sp. LNHC221B00]
MVGGSESRRTKLDRLASSVPKHEFEFLMKLGKMIREETIWRATPLGELDRAVAARDFLARQVQCPTLSVRANPNAFLHPVVMTPMPHPPHVATAIVPMPVVVAMRVAGNVAGIVIAITGAVIAAAIVVKRAAAVEGATAEWADAAERTKKAHAGAEELRIRRHDRDCGRGDGNHRSK